GALAQNGQLQQVGQAVVRGQQVSGHPDNYLSLRDIEPKARVEPIPATEDHGIVGVGLGADGRVVDAVHARGDQNLIQQPLQGQGQADIAVVKHGGAVEEELIEKIKIG